MFKRGRRPNPYVLAAAGAVVVAALAFSGVVLGSHETARLAVGALFGAAGIAWLARYMQTRHLWDVIESAQKTSEKSIEDLSEDGL